MFHEAIISFIASSPSFDWLPALKVLFIVFALLMLAVIAAMIFMTSWLKIRFVQDIFEFFSYRPFGVKKLTRQWAKTSARLETGLESEYKLAVIEADSLFDDVLKRMGYGGESVGERLDKVAPTIIPSIEEVRQAHKVRNNIVHDPDYRLELQEARNTLSIYEKALIDLGAL